MAYADTAFYTDTYGGTLSADGTLTVLLSRASDDIDRAVYGRIGALGGFSALTSFCQKQVQLAVCAQADYLSETDGLRDLPGLTRYEIGDVNVQLSASPPFLGERARAFLLPTMLLFRGV